MINLIHGDCLEKMADIPEKSIDMILVDPPFGTTDCSWDEVIPFDIMWKNINRIKKESAAVLIFGTEPFSSFLRISNIENYKYDWIWEKQQGANFINVKYQPFRVNECISVFGNFSTSYNKKKKKNYNPQMESGTPYICTSGQQKHKTIKNSSEIIGGCKTENNGSRYPRSILRFSHDKEKLHPTQKPVALIEYLIKTYSKEEDLVLDFAMGSCTTGIGCKNLNRNFIGIEKDEKYYKIAKDRLKAV